MADERSSDRFLEINVRDDNKIVEVWLTNKEKRDQALQEKLKLLYRDYKAQNYLVAVFLSGTENLEQRTSDLLCYNKKRIAEMEARQEKGQGMMIF